MSSLQQHFGLPPDLMPFSRHSVLLMVHLLPFIPAMCLAYFHFTLVMYWTMSVTLVLCLIMVLQLLFLFFVGFFTWHLAFSFPWLFGLFQVSLLTLWETMLGIHMPLLVRHTGWRPFFLDSWEGAYAERRLCTFKKTLHPASILIKASCSVLIFIAIVCQRYLLLATFSVLE